MQPRQTSNLLCKLHLQFINKPPGVTPIMRRRCASIQLALPIPSQICKHLHKVALRQPESRCKTHNSLLYRWGNVTIMTCERPASLATVRYYLNWGCMGSESSLQPLTCSNSACIKAMKPEAAEEANSDRPLQHPAKGTRQLQSGPNRKWSACNQQALHRSKPSNLWSSLCSLTTCKFCMHLNL